jgi:putative two-component system response regulator
MSGLFSGDERSGVIPAIPSEILEVAHLESLAQLSRIIELRDDTTGEHTARVARLSGMIAQGLRLPSEQIRRVHRVAPVHDIGKVVVPDHILLKPGPLTAQEQALMRRHTILASEIMGGSNSEIIRLAEQVARHHHERWDGYGYPDGLASDEIPLAARIVAVADAFDAMVNERPYRPAVPVAEVLEVLDQESGWQFDPEVVNALFRVLKEHKTTRLISLTAPAH